MFHHKTPPAQEVSSPQERQNTSFLTGFALIALAVAIMGGFSGVKAAEKMSAASDVPPSTHASSEKDENQAIQMVSGRYVPAYANRQGRILSLGDCGHTYIEIDQEGIGKRSGNRNMHRESFTKLSLSEPADTLKARYVLAGETEDMVDSSKGLSETVPKRRHSHYEIAYVEEEDRTYLTITQTDKFDLVDGNQKTVSSHGYYLPCPA